MLSIAQMQTQNTRLTQAVLLRLSLFPYMLERWKGRLRNSSPIFHRLLPLICPYIANLVPSQWSIFLLQFSQSLTLSSCYTPRFCILLTPNPLRANKTPNTRSTSYSLKLHTRTCFILWDITTIRYNKQHQFQLWTTLGRHLQLLENELVIATTNWWYPSMHVFHLLLINIFNRHLGVEIYWRYQFRLPF